MRPSRHLVPLALLLAGGLQLPGSALAQPSGAVQRRFEDQQLRQQIDDQRPQNGQPQRQPLIEGKPSAPGGPEPQPGEPQQSPIKGVNLDGATLFPPQQLQALRDRFIGQPATEANRVAIQQMVASWYDKAKLLAYVDPPTRMASGVIRVLVVEARLGAVKVERNTSPIASGWAIATVLSSVAINRELRLDKLESALLKLNDLGGVLAKARLEPGDMVGTTNVLLRLSTGKQVTAEIDLNNHVTEYTGPYQAQLNSGFLGLMGRGETVALDLAYSGNVDWYGSRNASLNVSVPTIPGGLNTVAAVDWSDYRLLSELASDQYVGSFRSANVGFSHDLWRRPKANLSARLIAEVDQFYDYVSGIQYSNRTNWVGRLSLAGDRQDRGFGGTGINSGLLTLSVGNLSKNADGENAFDAVTMGAAGAWGKLNLIANRYQMFKDSPWSLELFAQAQVGFNNLDSAEKMSLGWPNGVRAYPPGEAAGDSGLAGQFTARYRLARNLFLKGFVDGGYIQRWVNWFTLAQSPGSLGLWGPGIGVDWGTRGDVLLSVDLAVPLGNNVYQPSGLDVDGNNPDVRVWVSLKKWL